MYFVGSRKYFLKAIVDSVVTSLYDRYLLLRFPFAGEILYLLFDLRILYIYIVLLALF
jgi:hypothetical protein